MRLKGFEKRELPVPKAMKLVDSQNQVSEEKGDNEDELIITTKATLNCCRIYTQRVAESKGAPTVASEVFSVRLDAQVVDNQNFRVYLNNRDESDKEGKDADRA